MRALVIGQCFGYAASGYASAHGVEARDMHIARGLARRGYQVDLVATTSGPTEDGLLRRIGWDALGDYDLVVIVEITAWRHAKPRIGDRLARHPNVLGVLDAVYRGGGSEDLGFLRAVGLTTPQHVVRQRALHPGQDVFLLPWGMGELSSAPSPWPDVKPRAVYVGIVRDRFLEVLNHLATGGEVEIWLGGLFSVADRPWGGLTSAERERLCDPRLRFMSDLVPYVPQLVPPERAPSPTHYSRGEPGHGPVRYGDHFPFLAHAQVGLNFTIHDHMDVINCKLADYLGAGCRVVTEKGAVNNGDVVTLRAGRIVPWAAPEVFCRAVAEEARVPHDRRGAAGEAQALCSWAHVVDTILRHVRA